MKKKHVLGTVILIMIIMLVGCENKIDHSPSDNSDEFNTETFTDPTSSEDSSVPNEVYESENIVTESVSDDSIESIADAEEDSAEVQRSPSILWEYEGYIDECDGYTWQNEFLDCDYDGDGKNDRVKRSWDGEKETVVKALTWTMISLKATI